MPLRWHGAAGHFTKEFEMNVPGAKAVEVNQYRCRSLNVMQTKSKVRCARAASIFRASHSKSGPQQPRLALLKFKTRSRVRRVHTLTNEFTPVNFQACLPLLIALHIACATQPVAWGGGGEWRRRQRGPQPANARSGVSDKKAASGATSSGL